MGEDAYSSVSSAAASYDKTPQRGGSKWNPRNWTRKIWIIATVVLICALIVIIVPAVVVTQKSSAYPDYSALSYSLADTYEGEDFWTDNFDYYVGYDPTSGFVHYSNPTQSEEMNLTFASSSKAVLRVDNTETNASTGRHSARLTSKKQYDFGLFIFDVVHFPYGCASWPAVWLTDPSDWPNHGEIDVIEAVNNATYNTATLHTTNNCKMNVKQKQTGTTLTTNCYNGTDDNSGCGVKADSRSFEDVNSLGGGVYAMELRDAGIRVWFFDRSEIPSDITAGTPNPYTWSEAAADFPSTHCDIGTHFSNMSIIANIGMWFLCLFFFPFHQKTLLLTIMIFLDVCGSWAGSTSVYSTQDKCPGTSCSAYAAVNPAGFDEAYWEFNSFKVYSAA